MREARAAIVEMGAASNDLCGFASALYGGELQLSTNCTVQRVPLRRGDMAVYRSRHRHRVTTTTSPRRVLAVEWWRGKRTDKPHRPGSPGSLLQEPLTSWSSDSHSDGNVEAGGTSTVTNGTEEYEDEL